MRILIADDDAVSLAVLARALTMDGHEVVETTDGAAAWAALQQPDAPSLAILDWMMPEMDGLEVVRRARSLPTDRPPFLIILSARVDKSDIIGGLNSGANDYLTKPFDFGELLARVEVGRHTVEMQAALAAKNEELRLAQETLRDKERLLSESEKVAHLGSWSIELPGHQIDWSEEAYRVCGVSPQTFSPSFESLSSLIHPDDMAAMREWMRACLAGENPCDLEFRAMHPDRGFKTLLGRGSLIHDEQHRVIRVAGTIQDITQKKEAEAKIADLKHRLSMSEHEERRRIAASLHDCTVQDLVAVQLNLNRTIQMLGDGHLPVREILRNCAELVENNAGELRSLAYDLYAPWLQHGGLLSGIQEYARQFSSRTGIEVAFDAPPAIPRLQPIKEVELYRVMQESLMNVLRHSGAKQAWILVELSDNELRMTIRDAGGEGVPDISPNNRGGVGIISMHERMKAIGGRLDVCWNPDGVSTVAALPLGDENK